MLIITDQYQARAGWETVVVSDGSAQPCIQSVECLEIFHPGIIIIIYIRAPGFIIPSIEI